MQVECVLISIQNPVEQVFRLWGDRYRRSAVNFRMASQKNSSNLGRFESALVVSRQVSKEQCKLKLWLPHYCHNSHPISETLYHRTIFSQVFYYMVDLLCRLIGPGVFFSWQELKCLQFVNLNNHEWLEEAEELLLLLTNQRQPQGKDHEMINSFAVVDWMEHHEWKQRKEDD